MNNEDDIKILWQSSVAVVARLNDEVAELRRGLENLNIELNEKNELIKELRFSVYKLNGIVRAQQIKIEERT